MKISKVSLYFRSNQKPIFVECDTFVWYLQIKSVGLFRIRDHTYWSWSLVPLLYFYYVLKTNSNRANQAVAGSDLHQNKFRCKVEVYLWICPNQMWCMEGAYLSIPLNSSMKNAATYRRERTHWGKCRAKVINYRTSHSHCRGPLII